MRPDPNITTTAMAFSPFVNRVVTPEIIGFGAGLIVVLGTANPKVGSFVYGLVKAGVSAFMGGEYSIPTTIPGIDIPINPTPAE